MTVKIIPTMRYDDAKAAISWLSTAFGFHPHFVVPGEGEHIVHAQLRLGDAMIMLGSGRDDEFGKLQRTPETLGGTTQSAYIVLPTLDDLRAHYDRVVAAGARIVIPLTDQGYGWGYSCLDPQGHLWNFGDYDPFAPHDE